MEKVLYEYTTTNNTAITGLDINRECSKGSIPYDNP